MNSQLLSEIGIVTNHILGMEDPRHRGKMTFPKLGVGDAKILRDSPGEAGKTEMRQSCKQMTLNQRVEAGGGSLCSGARLPRKVLAPHPKHVTLGKSSYLGREQERVNGSRSPVRHAGSRTHRPSHLGR